MADEFNFTAIRPHLLVTDLEKAFAFYRDVLGFEVTVVTGDPPEHAIVVHGNVSLAFVVKEVASDVSDIPNCYIEVTNVDRIHDLCAAKGMTITHSLTNRPWGLRDFVVKDPDGHMLAFGERIG